MGTAVDVISRVERMLVATAPSRVAQEPVAFEGGVCAGAERGRSDQGHVCGYCTRWRRQDRGGQPSDGSVSSDRAQSYSEATMLLEEDKEKLRLIKA